SVDAVVNKLLSSGYPLESEADEVHAALQRLQTMLDRELDEAESLQAAGEWTFVADSGGAGASPDSTEQAGRMHHNEQAGRLHHKAGEAAAALELDSEDDDED
ncbi:MAG: hypothetical protein ACREHD_12200, partial [Pirellulales bacterium]